LLTFSIYNKSHPAQYTKTRQYHTVASAFNKLLHFNCNSTQNALRHLENMGHLKFMARP